MLALKECHHLISIGEKPGGTPPKVTPAEVEEKTSPSVEILPPYIVLLMASKVCLKDTFQYIEGVRYAQASLDLVNGPVQEKQVRIMLGLGLFLCARAATTHTDRVDLQEKSIFQLKQAADLVPGDNNKRVHYYLALVHAERREIKTAIKHARESLAADPYHSASWNILALLLSSNKQYKKALDVVHHGLSKQPADAELKCTKALLESNLEPVVALKTFQGLILSMDDENEAKKWPNKNTRAFYTPWQSPAHVYSAP